MKISELVNQLEKIRNENGDLSVYYFPYDWGKAEPLEKIVVTSAAVSGKTVLMIGDD